MKYKVEKPVLLSYKGKNNNAIIVKAQDSLMKRLNSNLVNSVSSDYFKTIRNCFLFKAPVFL